MTSHDAPQSLWMAKASQSLPNGALKDDINCDVAVIGAGFTGLRAAHKLAAAGTKVVVLDAGDVGYGASGRNGGQVNPILPFNGPDQLLKHVGKTYFERLTEASLGSADSLFEYIKKYQIECEARQKGWFRVDHCKKAKQVSRNFAEHWNKFGAEIEFVDDAQLHRLTGTKAYHSGILVRKGGAVQPLSLAMGIARVAKGAGARIFGQTPAAKLLQLADGWRIETPSGSVTAGWVILATNGYTDGLFRNLMKSLIPFISVQIATPKLPREIVDSILPRGQTISDTRRVIIYARREPDDRIVIGSHGNLSRNGTLSGFEWLKREAVRLFPQLENIEWEYAWGGKLAITDDRLPHFHEPANGLIAGLGYNGRGVAMSNLMGTVLADRVLGADPASLPFPVSPIKRVPFRDIQMLGKSTAVWWMQLLDKFETQTGNR